MGLKLKHLRRAIARSALSGVLSLWGGLPSLAGGYTQPQNFTFTSFTFSDFDTDTFHKQEIQFYLEHGIKDDLTLIFKSPYAWFDDSGRSDQGFGQQELGLRWRFNRDPNLPTAIQGILITPPSYEIRGDDPSSNQVMGLELSLPVSRSFQLGKERYGYGNLEVGYRDYLGAASDELRLTGEVSVDVLKRIAIATQFYGIFRLQSELSRAEEDFSKLGGQLRWGASDNLTVVVGGYKNVTENGGSFEAQLWYTFGPRRQESKPEPPLEPAGPSTAPSEP